MIPELRRRFNAAWSPERYRGYLEGLDAAAGSHVKFRQAETPCFFPKALLDDLAATGKELIEQLMSNPRYLADSRATIPPQYDVPREDPRPLFIQVDFGLVRNDAGALEPRLVEIQGFPSLYALQPIMARQYIESYGLPRDLGYLLGGLDDEGYAALMRRAIVADRDPENVILMEIDPLHQKTRADFTATEKLLGVRTVCISQVHKDGSKLYYECDGRRVPIERIYNRVIVDELARREIRGGFGLSDDLDVEWAGHPNWFFRISKFSIPYLRHPSVPATSFLNEMPSVPDDLDRWVLKPLFSFAGLGVIVGPTREQVNAIPPAGRSNYILQERVDFEPLIETPYGTTKAELRVMYIWLDDLIAVNTIVRMGRGKMMGVDHNRDMEWVGASAALWIS